MNHILGKLLSSLFHTMLANRNSALLTFDPDQGISEALTSVIHPELIKVTAIVSTYNSEKFIEGCLEDLLEQEIYELGQLEILVIDSNSQQSEGAFVKQAISRYQNVSYIRTDQRESLYRAWNRAICHAKGKYITNANTDDRHSPQALKIQMQALEQNPEYALAYADLLVTSCENQRFNCCTVQHYIEYPDFDFIRQIHFGQCGPHPMWRKDLHEKYGFFNEGFKICSDYEWWLRIGRFEKFIHIPAPLGLYLDSPTSVEHRLPAETNYETDLIRNFYAHSAGIKLDNQKYQNQCLQHFYSRYASQTVLDADLSIVLLSSAAQQTIKYLRCLRVNKSIEIVILTRELHELENLLRAEKINASIRLIKLQPITDEFASYGLGALHASSKWITFAADFDPFVDFIMLIQKLKAQQCQLYVSSLFNAQNEYQNCLRGLFISARILDSYRSLSLFPELVNAMHAVYNKARQG